MIKFYADKDGNYLGAYEGEAPKDGFEVDIPPKGDKQKWNGEKWVGDYITEKEKREFAMIEGVKIEGVMCSATKYDMFGIKSLKNDISSGKDVNFRFENGNSLLLTKENIDNFLSEWEIFRDSFF